MLSSLFLFSLHVIKFSFPVENQIKVNPLVTPNTDREPHETNPNNKS